MFRFLRKIIINIITIKTYDLRYLMLSYFHFMFRKKTKQ